MADRGGPTEQDRSEGMPSHSEAPNDRGKSPWLLGALPSDPRQGGTISAVTAGMDMYSVNNIQVGCQAAFAGKPAPTFELGTSAKVRSACRPPSRASLAPTKADWVHPRKSGRLVGRLRGQASLLQKRLGTSARSQVGS
ncbi:hypothetical protein CES87_31550 [Pseudomonas sp. ERMR1:02]|nr:hypothetical protein CES87_31550 [Pseudomonas sp. ERMR1:02]